MSTQSIGQHRKLGTAVLICAFLTLAACMDNTDERPAPAPPPSAGAGGATTTTTATTPTSIVTEFVKLCAPTGVDQDDAWTAYLIRVAMGLPNCKDAAEELSRRTRLDMPLLGKDVSLHAKRLGPVTLFSQLKHLKLSGHQTQRLFPLTSLTLETLDLTENLQRNILPQIAGSTTVGLGSSLLRLNLNKTDNAAIRRDTSELGDLLKKLPRLAILHAEDNGYTAIDQFLAAGALPDNVKELSLAANQITTIPADKLGVLEKLSMRNNGLTNAAGLDKTPSLQMIDLSNNGLVNGPAGLPDNLVALDKLIAIDLTNNKLTTLPKFKEFVKAINVSQNTGFNMAATTELPKSLERFYAKETLLNTVAPFRDLPNLQYLDLSKGKHSKDELKNLAVCASATRTTNVTFTIYLGENDGYKTPADQREVRAAIPSRVTILTTAAPPMTTATPPMNLEFYTW